MTSNKPCLGCDDPGPNCVHRVEEHCPQCGPTETCSKCGQKYPHTERECQLKQLHVIKAFGIEIPVEVELRPSGRPKIADLDGPLYYTIHVKVRGAGAFFETTEPGLDWVVEETHEARRQQGLGGKDSSA